MTSAWLRQQDRKRSLQSAALTACLYVLAFAAAWALGLVAPASLASTPSTVIVDLGNGEGPAGQVPLGLPNAPDRPEGAPPGAAPAPAAGSGEAPAEALPQVPIEPPPAAKEATSAPALPAPPAPKAAPAKAAPAKTASKPKAAPAKSAAKTIPEKSAKQSEAEAAAAAQAAVAAQERAAAEAAALRAAAATAQAQSGPPKTKTFGSSSGSGSGGAPVTAGGTGSAPGVVGGTGSYTFRGAEQGNSLSYTFGGSSGVVGRNIYVPIYLYMPLPQRVPESIYRNIAAKATFRLFYAQSGSDWVLKAQPPVAQRGDVWNMLENAGFDASTADFKVGRKLSPVVLEFAVGPSAKNRTELVDVRLVSSSGAPDIDEAVMYGFRQASFFNKTGFAVGGKFVYGF